MIVSLLSSLVMIGCYWKDIQGQRFYSHQRLQGYRHLEMPAQARSSEPLLPILHSACLLLCAQPSADSWACFTEAQEEALIWACSSSQSLNQNQPLSLVKVGKLQAGWETRGRGQQCIPACLPISQVPGAAFQGLLQSQLRRALEGDGATSLP